MVSEMYLSRRLPGVLLGTAIAGAVFNAGRDLRAGLSGADLAQVALVEVGDWPQHLNLGAHFGDRGAWQSFGPASQIQTMTAITGTGATYGMDLAGGGPIFSFSSRKKGPSNPGGGSANNGSSGSTGGSNGDGPTHAFVSSSNDSGFRYGGGGSNWDYVTNNYDDRWRKNKSTDTTNCNPPPSRYSPPSCYPPPDSGGSGGDGDHDGRHDHEHDKDHDHDHDPGDDDHHHHHHHHHHIVPEPGGMTLWGVGMFGLVGWSLRSRKESV